MNEPAGRGKRNFWMAVAVGALVLSAAAALLWRPVLAVWNVARAEAMFRSSYSHDSRVVIQMTDVDWTVEFLGQCGSETIRRLKQDPAITDRGKKKLELFLVLIESGRTLAELEEGRRNSGWLNSIFWDYVVSRNQKAADD